jgi:hypothetical protein
MKGRLLGEALVEAKRKYEHRDHAVCEENWRSSVSTRLNNLAKKYQEQESNANLAVGATHSAGPDSRYICVGVALAIVVGLIVVGLFVGARPRFVNS